MVYEITYETESTPISLKIEADDPFTACMILGRKTSSKKTRILKIVEYADPLIRYQAPS